MRTRHRDPAHRRHATHRRNGIAQRPRRPRPKSGHAVLAAAGLAATAALGVAVAPTASATAAPTASAGLAAPTASAGAGAIEAVGPQQWFTGDVNGTATGAVIKVGCFGPVTPASTGHPLAGQTVAVHHVAAPATKSAGYTGDSADRIVVGFEDAGPVVGLPVSVDAYDTAVAVPTDLQLPCYGPGKVDFVPVPTSSTARSTTVAVTYVSIGD